MSCESVAKGKGSPHADTQKYITVDWISRDVVAATDPILVNHTGSPCVVLIGLFGNTIVSADILLRK